MNGEVTDACREAARLDWQARGFAARPGGVNLFERRLPDALTRSHPATPYLVVVPLVVFLGVRAAARIEPLPLAACAAGGWLAWTLIEYLMHRFLFHWPARTEAGRVVVFLVHGHHHVFPEDALRIAATPLQFGSLLALFAGALVTLLPAGCWEATLAGVAIGYLAYELAHWRAHHARPATRFGRALQRHHLAHHHRDPRSNWGIGSPLWDWILRTGSRS